MADQKKARASFRPLETGASIPKSPRELFFDLRRDETVKFLWDHQAKQLDEYSGEFAEASDVALELPTGTGKTLVGLLVAEWRRRTFDERVAYLCPTRQLARQVAAQAEMYGIDVRPVLAPDYESLREWSRGEIIAVTTYAAVFNSAPKISGAQSFVLDDAHAADGFISSAWTTRIRRSEMPETYTALLNLVRDAIEPSSFRVLVDDNAVGSDRKFTEIVPLPLWWPISSAIVDLLDERLKNSDARYSWNSKTKHELFANNLIVGWDEIQLSPQIPTTLNHPEFGDANQRLYMSATLGASGDLERAFGIREIGRIPIPPDWEKHSSGRRLFLFPEESLSPGQTTDLSIALAEQAGRALDLVPSEIDAQSKVAVYENAGFEVVLKHQIEDNLDAFTESSDAVLVLANRYDGIDLPGDDCRLMFLDGLPVATDLFERFLFQRLSVSAVLRERMLTRFTQGVGRCSRSASDFSAVVVLGRSALDFVSRSEVRNAMHPELQAEIEFGFKQSEDRASDDFTDLFEMFLENGDDWKTANAQIADIREKSTREVPATAATLLGVAKAEVDFAYALARKDFPGAVERAVAVTDDLGGPDFAGYRSWWMYCGGSAAWLAGDHFDTDDMKAKARELFSGAAATGRGVGWFADLAYRDLGEQDTSAEFSRTDLEAAERVHAWLNSAGLHGNKFERRLAKSEERLGQTDATQFEVGLEDLGKMLGWHATRPDTDSAPDSVWICGEHRLTFEAKSDESPDGTIGSRTTTQCAAQPTWASDAFGGSPPFLPVLVSPRTTQTRASKLLAGEVSWVSLTAARELMAQTATFLRDIRARIAGLDGAADRQLILEAMRTSGLLPGAIHELLRHDPLLELPVDSTDESDDE